MDRWQKGLPGGGGTAQGGLWRHQQGPDSPHLTLTVVAGAVEGSSLADTGKTEARVQTPLCPPRPVSSPALRPPPPPPRPRPSPAGAVPGEHGPGGQLLGPLFRGQGEAPGQRELGAGTRGRGHTGAIVQQLGQRGLQLHSGHGLSPTPPQPGGSPGTAPAPTRCPGQPQPGWQGSGVQRAPGRRCEQRRGHEVAQALNTWPGGHSGGSAQIVTESPREGAALDCHLPWRRPAGTGPWAPQPRREGQPPTARVRTRAGLQVTVLPLLRVLGLAWCPPRALLTAPMALGGAPTTGSRAAAPG